MKRFSNKELKRGGIYSITNTITGRVYFGNTANLYTRLTSHITTLGLGIHANPGIREDGKKYGACDFAFKVLHFEEDRLVRKELEKGYILLVKNNYNQTPSLVKFTGNVTTIKRKVKKIQSKLEEYDAITLCYKTK